MSTWAQTAESAPMLLPPLLNPVLPAAHWPAGQAEWLLAVGAAGLVAAALAPGSAVVRLRGPTNGGGEDGAGRSALRIRRLRVRIALARGREPDRRRRAVAELCAVLAAELRAGRSPGDAMVTAVDELDPESGRELAPLSEAARGGQDLVTPLRALAGAHGARGLDHLAACWRVAADTGAGLADVVDRLSVSLASEEALRRELGAQLAGPRATAVLLSVLPVLGLGMATALGGSPLAFLFTTPAGLLCLAAGLALDAAGLFWTHRMVRRVLSESGLE